MTSRLSTLSGGSVRASRKSELAGSAARTPVPPPLPQPDAVTSDDAAPEHGAKAAEPPVVVAADAGAEASPESTRHKAAAAAASTVEPDASTAPTLRPPPAVHSTNAAQATLRIGSPLLEGPAASRPPPLPSSAHASSAATVPRLSAIPIQESTRNEHRSLGFTSVIRHLSLRGWLRWIQSNQCDATLRVRTRDGGSGCIWCSAGKVVDAEWSATPGGSTSAPTSSGEPALMELLRLDSGSVSIDFDPVERPRRIARITMPLEDMPLEDMPLEDMPLEDMPLEHMSLEHMSLDDLPLEAGPLEAGPLQEGRQPSAPALRAPARSSRLTRTEYFAGGILLGAFVLLAFAFGRQRAGSDELSMVVDPRRAQETQALLPPPALQKAPPRAPSVAPEPKDLSLIRFATLEVEPAQAEIWLDHSLLGLGHVELAPLLDGELHELRFVAAGRAARSLYFVGSPPSGRVVLEQDAPAAAPAAPPGSSIAEPEAVEELPSEPPTPQRSEAEHSAGSPIPPRVAARATPRRRSAAAAPVTAPAPARTDAAPSAKMTSSKKSPQIQLIEAHTPRVQVLD